MSSWLPAAIQDICKCGWDFKFTMRRSNSHSEEAPTHANSVFQCLLCASAFFVHFIGFGFYFAFGSIYVAMQREFKESNAVIAWVGSLSISLMFFASPVAFKVHRVVGYRVSILIGGILFGLSLIGASLTSNIYVIFLTLGVVLALGQSLCYFATIMILPLYFKKNQPLAHGLVMCGSSLGGLVQAPVLGFILRRYGFSKGLRLCSVTSLPLIALSFVFKKPGESFGFNGFKRQEANVQLETTTKEGDGVPLRRNKAYILFIFANMFCRFGVYIAYVHVVRLALDNDVSYSKAVFLPGIASFAQGLGKIAYGKLSARRGTSAIVLFIFAAVGMSLSMFVPLLSEFVGLTIFSLVYGVSAGAYAAANLIVVRDVVSKRQLERGFGISTIMASFAVLAGPPFAGYLYTVTGTYTLAFITSGGLAALGAGFMLAARYLHAQAKKNFRAGATDVIEAKQHQTGVMLQSFPDGSPSENGQEIFTIDNKGRI